MGGATLPAVSPETDPFAASPIETDPVGEEMIELGSGIPDPIELGPLAADPLKSWKKFAPLKTGVVELEGSAPGATTPLESAATVADAATVDEEMPGVGISCRTPDSGRPVAARGNGIEFAKFNAAATKLCPIELAGIAPLPAGAAALDFLAEAFPASGPTFKVPPPKELGP
jgi:hypothetical protein